MTRTTWASSYSPSKNMYLPTMKRITHTAACLTAAVLMTLAAGVTASSAATALNAQLVLRPLTPGDVIVYKLPATTEASPGITTLGIGSPAYLEAEINVAIAPSNIVSVTWVLTNRPAGSAASITNSPLPSTMPVYEVADRSQYQVASRALLRPDVVGQYTVVATVVTTGSGSTNISKTLTAGTYMGLNTCTLCHSGGVVAEDKFSTWQNTAHAHIFTDEINGVNGTTYRSSCLPCHTVGYNANTNVIVNPNNGGFDDVARQLGWSIPAVLAPTNWAYMQATSPSLANLANIQCENCHGPGSQHAYSLGNTNYISKTLNSGDCNQCHDAPTHHIYGTQWYTSGHANPTRTPSGPSRWACVGCHTSAGFISRMDNNGTTNTYVTNTVYGAIGCQTCHEAHGDTTPTNSPHLLRNTASVTLPDGTVVTNAGNGSICMQCHQVRNGSCSVQLTNYPVGKPTWLGGSAFGVHDASQADMIEGANAFTYGQNIPSSAHRNIPNVCVACHMQEAGYGSPAYLQAGGHTFGLTYNVVTTNGSTLVTNTHEMVEACAECHGPVESFNLVRQDYNGDGVIEGVQTEVQKLLNKLSTMLPNSTYQANSNNYGPAGVVQTSMSFKTNWPAKYLKAGYNWQFVNTDASKGVHNAPFAVGLLRASIGDLSGDSNNDGLPDSWQIQWFQSANSALAAPNATPAGDGVPNWMKYLLGLNPNLPGISITNGLSVGVVWADGSSLQNPYGATNTIQIFTAAEVAFNTLQNKTYQIQAASSLSSGWQNIGAPIPGTGNAVSYVTPTRKDVKQFYRVYSY
jgi:hypothetical protein